MIGLSRTHALTESRSRPASNFVDDAVLSDSLDPVQFDCLIAADFTRTGDLSYRLAQEARFLHAHGQRVGLLQTREPEPGAIISAEIRTCIRRGVAAIAPDAVALNPANLVLHEPATVDWGALPALGDKLGNVAVVCHSADDLAVPYPFFGPAAVLRSFVTNPLLRPEDRARLDGRDWLPPLLSPDANRPGLVPSAQGVFAVGWLSADGLTGEQMTACLQATSAFDVRTEHFQLGADASHQMARLPRLSLDRLTQGLDTLVFIPAEDCVDLPDTLIAASLSAGLNVVLPMWLRQHYGRGPVYAQPGRVGAALAKRMTSPRRKKAQASFVMRCRSAPLADYMTGAPARIVNPPQARPVLCLSANGVGIGHLTRLLAIARQMPGPVVFVTQAPAVGVVEDFGYRVHYIPSAAAVGGDFEGWDRWLKVQFEELLDLHDPSVVVYDGNHPSWGLIEAVASRRDCRLAWVRRGMWASTTSEFLSNARWCDIVIEPGDLAEERDFGVTASRRHEATCVDPIRLLDHSDLVERQKAAAILGLNPARPAVLIQLGSGYNRDLLTLLDQIIAMATDIPGLQICVAEWVTGTVPLTLWPHVTVLRGFPICQYVRAFDFCISAAGYNSFHELIGLGVPTVFLANRHPSMDDQHGRARFAQDSAAAFEIASDDLSELPDLLALLMQDAARRFLTDRCRQFERPNGAAAAARLLAALPDMIGSP